MHTSPAPMSMPHRLSAAWLFLILTLIFRDLHEFIRPGFLAEAQTGVVNGTEITEGLLLFGGFLATALVAMVFVPHIVPRVASRWIIGFGVVMQAAIITTSPRHDLDDTYFAALHLLILAYILWLVIRWRA